MRIHSQNGTLSPIQDIPSGGKTPPNVAIAPTGLMALCGKPGIEQHHAVRGRQPHRTPDPHTNRTSDWSASVRGFRAGRALTENGLGYPNQHRGG